jgi:uncharacterized protein (DUF697 family)
MKTRDHCKVIAEKYMDSAGLGMMLPLPGLTVVVTAVEARMVQEIAGAYGERLTGSEAAKWIVLSGAKNYGVKLAGEAMAFIPVFGWLARPILTRWTTARLADTTIHHFEAKHADQDYAPKTTESTAASAAQTG